MARLISDILGAREPDFTHELRRVELLAGHPKEDIRLISELARLSRELASDLSLDRNDTAAKEIYFALRSEIVKHNDKLSNHLGIKDSDDVESVVKKCINYVKSQMQNPVWTIKSSVLKYHLKNNPPKKTLKILGLRSIDSALKREPLAQLVLLAEIIESKAWIETHAKLASKLKNSDFDKKKVDISIVEKPRQVKLEKAGYNLREVVYCHLESGGIFVLPPKKRFRVDVVFYIDALFRQASEIRRFSSFSKFLSVRSDFGGILSSARLHGLDGAGVMHFNFGWSPMHHFLHKKIDLTQPAMFEPHLDHDDVRIERYEPAKIWSYRYLVHNKDGIIISSNISDVILNTANNAPIENTSYSHAKKELYGELFSRYLEHDQVLKEFLEGHS